ncbi:MAG: MBL fold metallo-hydrolase [Anaerolineae bacterium]|nr:MBL fold metallo-hydrolase [Anaerolineae bacterium]
MKRVFLLVNALLALVVIVGGSMLWLRHNQAVAQVDQAWANTTVQPLGDIGSTRSLTILPLIERNTEPGLSGEPGVSYLVTTDSATILFDVGYNADGSAPLRRNMDALDVGLESVDALVISHLHLDHVGGWQPMIQHTFNLGGEPVDLADMPIYTPVDMTYPGSTPTTASQPTVIAPGVATSGSIAFPELFPIVLFGDPNYEQSLLIQVEGYGIVAISGCGHPTLQKILTRADALFEQPVVGIVGGLHYPNSDGKDIQPNIAYLEGYNPQIVGLSPHDSSPAAIQAFRNAFPDVYRDVAVGQAITFGA